MSELRADTITGSDGSSPVTLTKQQAAKALIDFDGRSSTTVDKSMNISGLVDETTGRYTISYTTSYDSADYHFIAGTCTDEDNDTNAAYLFSQRHNTVRTSSQIQTESFFGNAGNSRVENDADNCNAVWFGDLA